jgi:hypothetical protein
MFEQKISIARVVCYKTIVIKVLILRLDQLQVVPFTDSIYDRHATG